MKCFSTTAFSQKLAVEKAIEMEKAASSEQSDHCLVLIKLTVKVPNKLFVRNDDRYQPYFRPVTGDAMLLNQWSNVFLKNCRRIRLPSGHALHAPHQNADADDPVAEWMKLKHGQIRRDPTGIQC